jgi:DNA mismatch repair ATPase MutS
MIVVLGDKDLKPNLGISQEKSEFFNELEQKLKLTPDFERLRKRYRIVTNSQRILVQRKNCLGFWVKTRSSCLVSSFWQSTWCDAVSLEDARIAIIQNLEVELKKIESEKNGWKILED